MTWTWKHWCEDCNDLTLHRKWLKYNDEYRQCLTCRTITLDKDAWQYAGGNQGEKLAQTEEEKEAARNLKRSTFNREKRSRPTVPFGPQSTL